MFDVLFSASQTPTLEGRKVVLRRADPDDAADMARLIGAPDVARMLGDCPLPFTERDAIRWLHRSVKDARHGRAFIWSIVWRGGFVGMTSLERAHDEAWELGYWIGKPYWGRGLATDAAKVTCAHAFGDMGADRLLAGHFFDNGVSAKILMRLGFQGVTEDEHWCAARRAHVRQIRLTLERTAWDGRAP